MLLRAMSGLRSGTERLGTSALLRSKPGQVRVGARARIRSPLNVTVGPAGRLTIGAGSIVERGSHLTAVGRLVIGADCFVSVGAVIGCEAEVAVGDRVAMGPYCVVIDTVKVFDDVSRPIIGQGHASAPVRIEDDCWLGAGVTVLPGVTIGRRSIIGAGAVVTKSVPEGVIADGVPATVRRTLGR